MRKLNLGCGTDIRKGWINLDSKRLPGVDVVHDLNKKKLPFKKDRFDEVLCQDVLEHIDKYPRLLGEIFRVMKRGGRLRIRVPHFTSRYNYIDPTHVHRFSFRTFDHFLKNNPFGRGYYFDFCFGRIAEHTITFEKRPLFYNHVVEALVNISDSTRGLYESTFLSRLFPALDIEVVLEK